MSVMLAMCVAALCGIRVCGLWELLVGDEIPRNILLASRVVVGVRDTVVVCVTVRLTC